MEGVIWALSLDGVGMEGDILASWKLPVILGLQEAPLKDIGP